MLDIYTLAVSPFMQNARIFADSGTGNALLIDPGGDAEMILEELESRKLSCREIWLTHSHLDHCGAVRSIIAKTSAKLTAHPAEKQMRENVQNIARMYGIPDGEFEDCPEPDRLITGGEELEFGGVKFSVLFTPGHSPGHVSFYCREQGFVLGGDALFAGSIGRTDLPGGDYETLISSIRRELFTLPPDTKVLSGHGPDTTISTEQRTNPFLTV